MSLSRGKSLTLTSDGLPDRFFQCLEDVGFIRGTLQASAPGELGTNTMAACVLDLTPVAPTLGLE